MNIWRIVSGSPTPTSNQPDRNQSHENGRYWSCPGCGVRRQFDGPDIGRCWRCGVTFDPEALIECGLTGNEPLPFGERLNRLTDGD